ncbi:MAG: T9SS type A sorting domain-containing protein [Bacteroidia bacterium]
MIRSNIYFTIVDDVDESIEIDSTNSETEKEELNLEIEEIKASLAPNPVINKATITFPKKSKYKFFITDIQGQVKYDERCKCESFELNTSELKTGSYLLTIIDLKSKNKQVLKFVK